MRTSLRNRHPRFLGLLAAAVATALSALLFSATNANAATPTAQVVLFGSDIGALYQGSGSNASTAVVVTHETDDFINAAPCTQLVQRGFTALCFKSQYTSDGEISWDQLAIGVGKAVSYLRSLSGIKHVVLVGWSGGGAISAYYQNVAENGVAACQGADELDPCSDSLAGLPPADGVVLLDSIPGLAFADTGQLNASVIPADGLTSLKNPFLDPFRSANGYNSDETMPSAYTQEFIDRYTQAQGDREAALVDAAQRLQQQIKGGREAFTNDLPFLFGHDAAAIWSLDPNILGHTQGAYPLITPSSPNGTVQVVYTVRNPAAAGSLASTPASDNTWGVDKTAYSVNTFMSVSAIKAPRFRLTADSIEGVDWASSNTATVANVAGISKPLLVMGMTAHYWMVPAELYYKAATRSSSKTLAFVYGAIHGFTPCTACTSMPYGPYGDTEGETFNYVANWLQTHF